MKIVLISGSSRKGSQSAKVTAWLESQLSAQKVETEVVDLHQLALPIRHDEIWSEIEGDPAAVSLRQSLDSADGFVVVTPEWCGMASPALKNMFIYVKHTMAYKPAYLVAVSAVRGGAYPIAELRMNTAKNSYVNYIPEHLIVRSVAEVMNDEEFDVENEMDSYAKSRALYGLNVLQAYVEPLSKVRSSNVLDYEKYANGM